MLTPGQTVSLAIEKPAAGGRMIARMNGQVVLVSGAIPGERVRARIERVGKGVAYANTVEVEEPSADRREGFGDLRCGGSLYGHITYGRQLDIKSQVIADAFGRIGRLPLQAPVSVSSSREDGYRLRARLHVRGHHIGFFREGTHDVCDPRQTQQLLSATCDALDRVAAAIHALGIDSIREVELSENLDATERVVHFETTSALDERATETLIGIEGLTPGPYVTDVVSVSDHTYALRRHVLSFFQGNRYLLQDLVAHVIDRIPIGTTVLDLYAGAGLFAIAAAVVRAASATAVEGDRVSADDLLANAAASGRQFTTVRQSVEAFLSAQRLSGKAATPAIETIIVDPPRTGMSSEALDGVVRLKAGRLIYVSCDVATLARDSRRIVDAGYTIERIDAFDLFPNTPHVETVVVFRRT